MKCEKCGVELGQLVVLFSVLAGCKLIHVQGQTFGWPIRHKFLVDQTLGWLVEIDLIADRDGHE